MAIKVKAIKLWRGEIDNNPGTLASALGPLAKAGADLQILMGYRYPGNQSKAAVELFPISRKKAATAANAAGLKEATLPALLVEGNNKKGTGHVLAKALAEAGINIDFLVALVIGKRYSAVFGFETDADAQKAATVIKKAAKKK